MLGGRVESHTARRLRELARPVRRLLGRIIIVADLLVRPWWMVAGGLVLLGTPFILGTINDVWSISHPASAQVSTDPAAHTVRVPFVVACLLVSAAIACAIAATILVVWARRATPRSLGLVLSDFRLRSIGLIAMATAAYVFVVWGGWQITSFVTDHTGLPVRYPHDGGQQSGKRTAFALLASASAGIGEELQLLAIPIALFDRVRTRLGRWHVPVTLAVLISLRVGFHLRYGWATLTVVPWICTAYLLYRVVGSIWPLIIGHALYDSLVFINNMHGSAAATADRSLEYIVYAGGLAFVVILVRRQRVGTRPRAAELGEGSI